ncbi:M56 family metallopeptidase [Mycolicibacterium sp.]|uniref:M56 family metallopeptidase n=1 Tax=Mycolicibacterium sp. TaxID=2320850 RepID=UPI0037C77737
MTMLVFMLALAWCLAAVLTVFLRRVQMCFTPGWQVRLLALGGLALAFATLNSTLALLCAAGVFWHLAEPVLWIVVGVGVMVVGWRPSVHLFRICQLSRGSDVFRRAATRPDGLLVVGDDHAQAFAVPGRGGTVVVTDGLRKALTAAEFEAVVRHERAHLRHRHHFYVQMAELAACINPLLGRWCGAVRFAAERHADEEAAQAGRAVAARAITKAALSTSQAPPAVPGRLGISAGADTVVRRVDALRGPGPRRQRAAPLVAAVLLLAVIGVDLVGTSDWIQDRLIPEAGESVSVVYG